MSLTAATAKLRLRFARKAPKVQRRIAQLIKEDRFYTQVEQDNLDDVNPIAIREALAQRGIVDGHVVDSEKLDNDPFVQQVMRDVEAISRETAQADQPEQPSSRQFACSRVSRRIRCGPWHGPGADFL